MEPIIEFNVLNPQPFRDFVPGPVRERNLRNSWIMTSILLMITGAGIFLYYQVMKESVICPIMKESK
jgi:hypothetical protein